MNVKAREVQGIWKKRYDQIVLMAKEVNATEFIDKLTRFVNLSPETMVDSKIILELTAGYQNIATEAKANAGIGLHLDKEEFSEAAVVAAGTFQEPKKTEELFKIIDKALEVKTFKAAHEVQIILMALLFNNPNFILYLEKVLAIYIQQGKVDSVVALAAQFSRLLTKKELMVLKRKCEQKDRKQVDQLILLAG